MRIGSLIVIGMILHKKKEKKREREQQKAQERRRLDEEVRRQLESVQSNNTPFGGGFGHCWSPVNESENEL